MMGLQDIKLMGLWNNGGDTLGRWDDGMLVNSEDGAAGCQDDGAFGQWDGGTMGW